MTQSPLGDRWQQSVHTGVWTCVRCMVRVWLVPQSENGHLCQVKGQPSRGGFAPHQLQFPPSATWLSFPPPSILSPAG